MFDILMLSLIVILFSNLLLSYFSNKRLQARLASCEKQLAEQNAPKPLTQEQMEFKNNLEKKWVDLFTGMQTKIEEKLQGEQEEIQSHLNQWKVNFMTQLNEDYKKACDSIAFHTVQYKKTITKKRKETSRKTTPQQTQKYRSIDDE